MRNRNAMALVLVVCLALGLAPAAWAVDGTILWTETLPDEPIIETRLEQQTLSLPNDQRERDQTVASQVIRTDRTLERSIRQGKGFRMVSQKTYKLTDIRQDTVVRTTEVFARSARQTRTITCRTPRWKTVAHCQGTRFVWKVVPRTVRVKREEDVLKSGKVWFLFGENPSCPRSVSLTRTRTVTRQRPVTKTRMVTVYEEVQVFDHVEPGKIIGYKWVPYWPFRVAIKSADQWVYRTEIVEKQVPQEYTEMETYSAEEPYTIPATMTKVVLKVPYLLFFLRVFAEVTWYEREWVEREEVAYLWQLEPQSYLFDQVINRWDGTTSVFAGPWQAGAIAEYLLSRTSKTVLGEPYPDKVSYEHEAWHPTLARAGQANMKGRISAFTSNAQVGRAVGKVSYAGISDRTTLGIDAIAVQKQEKKAEQPGNVQPLASDSLEALEAGLVQASSTDECERIFQKAFKLLPPGKAEAFRKKAQERWCSLFRIPYFWEPGRGWHF